MIQKIKDPISSLTHLFAAIVAIPLTATLVFLAHKYSTPWHVVSFFIFGMALFLLYSSSALYHMLYASESVSKILRKIDHMMIFVLIAGTYTPICLVSLRGSWGICLFVIIWLAALSGILLKIFWFNAPRWLSTSIYLGMGWLVILAFYPLYKNMPIDGIVLLLLGGLSYSIGAIIYAIKLPNFTDSFGFHELFHLFVMLGSAFHIVVMFKYVLLA